MWVCVFVYVRERMPELKMCSPPHEQQQYLFVEVKPTEEMVSSSSENVQDLQHCQIQLCSLTQSSYGYIPTRLLVTQENL